MLVLSIRLSLFSSIYRRAFPADIAKFGHPNELGQVLIQSAQVGIIEKLAARIKRFLDGSRNLHPKILSTSLVPA